MKRLTAPFLGRAVNFRSVDRRTSGEIAYTCGNHSARSRRRPIPYCQTEEESQRDSATAHNGHTHTATPQREAPGGLARMRALLLKLIWSADVGMD
jgi:hypothetical protein